VTKLGMTKYERADHEVKPRLGPRRAVVEHQTVPRRRDLLSCGHFMPATSAYNGETRRCAHCLAEGRTD
jgi:hypothetical protein